MTSVPGFLTKTFEIFSSPEYADCCGWGPNGDTIIIRKIEQFSKQILPKYFKHSNFQSFVRQLNMYDFHKTVQDPNHGEFQHQYFRQNQPELLIYIKRKANNRGTETLKKFSTSSGKQPTTQSIPPMPLPPSSSSSQNLQNSVLPLPVNSSSDDPLSLEVPFTSEALTKLLPEEIVQETDSVFQELELQKLMREDFEKRMEEKLSKVEGENQMLKRLFFESHQKNLVLQERMERVLKTLYSVFVGGQAGKALNGRMPSMLLTEYPPQANSGQPLKAILDKDSAVEDNKGTKRRSSRQHKSSNQYDLDTPLLDLSSFEKLPSIDFGNSSSYEGGTSNVEQYMQIKNSLAGKELSRSDRITSSFDYAAASVAPPLRYLPSFDSTYFSPTPEFNLGDDNNSLVKSMNGSENYHSDRVTLLSEDTDNSGADPGQRLGSGSAVDDRVALGSSSSVNTRSSSRRNARSSSDLPSNALTHLSPTSSLPTSQSDSYLQSRERSSKRAHEPDQSVVDQNQIKEGDTIASLPDEFVEKRRKIGAERGESHALQSLKLPNNDETLPQSKPSSEDIQLMDLLHRNQDSTLTRLDSLEQTIATLLEGIEYDDPLPETDDAPLISNEDQASANPSLTDTTSTGRNYANLSALAVSSTSQMYNQDDESADAAR